MYTYFKETFVLGGEGAAFFFISVVTFIQVPQRNYY